MMPGGDEHDASPWPGDPIMTNAVTLHRVLRAPPDHVYETFVDPDAMARWLPPYGFVAHIHALDARVGGRYRTSFRNFRTGTTQFFVGTFLELVPGKKLVHTDQFEDPNLAGTITVTETLRAVACGTDLTIRQEGLPDAIPVEFCCLGWQESLAQLAHLVETDIPDEG
jgi:uncharacterized protein YndB with AHSA1/START domain